MTFKAIKWMKSLWEQFQKINVARTEPRDTLVYGGQENEENLATEYSNKQAAAMKECEIGMFQMSGEDKSFKKGVIKFVSFC